MHVILPGIWKHTLGEPEKITPVKGRHQPPAEERFRNLSVPGNLPPLDPVRIRQEAGDRGFMVELPLDETEQLYGLGLQLMSVRQRGKKKTLRVNSDPTADLGDSHAPVPFYVSTKGYAVLVDTARYATFHMGCAMKKQNRHEQFAAQSKVSTDLQGLYNHMTDGRDRQVIVEIPYAAGVDLYIFEGPTMREAVARYNLFSGGGCVPPRWGLGLWYRARADFRQEQVLQFAENFRKDRIPCDVMGIEPGWQTHSYSCSHVWSDKFPDPGAMVQKLRDLGFRTNLWTHAFTHPVSPIYRELFDFSGDYEVFNRGIVPDFTEAHAREIFAKHYEKTHVALGVSGYKLDECDGSDFVFFPWSFPEAAKFPSGMDGETYHSVFGMNFQQTIDMIYRRRNERAYHEVRNAHALAAPYPFVLYSDLYKHKDFIRGVLTAGFSGLLWCPEVREGESAEDFVRRVQVVCLSPQALINAWYIKNPPWKQWRNKENNEDVLMEDPSLENLCRKFFELRMRLVPYLYAAFYDYYLKGIPPFRALVMDHPEDVLTHDIEDQWYVGDRMIVAAVVAGQTEREIYLPAGTWHDFWTGEKVRGGAKFMRTTPLDQIPIYVRDGSLLPLAEPTLHAGDPASRGLTVQVYGSGNLGISLYEDDDSTLDYEKGRYNTLTLHWEGNSLQAHREGAYAGAPYTVIHVEHRG